MKNLNQRVKTKSALTLLQEFLHKYAYLETLIIMLAYIAIGYLIDHNDPCMLHYKVPYPIIILAIVTLFHGFENGIIAVTIFSATIWIAYETFQYIDFLIALLMTLVFSQFHYYWTSRIKEAEVSANFKAHKLSELSRAFYTLKISHDQLEKNYVIKPMSIRNSIQQIIKANEQIMEDDNIHDKMDAYNKNFIHLLEKSFSLSSGLIIYLNDESFEKDFTEENVAVIATTLKTPSVKSLFENHLIDKVLARKSAVYVSDDTGEPSVDAHDDAKYLAAIPAMINDKIVSILVVEKMPFMFFNRENLTSITILHEYFTIETKKSYVSKTLEGFELIEDKDFKFEVSRLSDLHKRFQVNSVILVLRINNELQTARLYQKVEHMLRSLDMITLVKNNDFYYITLLLPLHDKAAAIGLLNRLKGMLQEQKDKEFDYMTFSMDKLPLLSKYYREDYVN